MADDINGMPGEDDSLNKDNSLTETDALSNQTEMGDPGGPSERMAASSAGDPDTGTGFGERLDPDLGSDISGFDDTAGQDESLMEKAKDKYREIMSDDK